MKDSVPNNAAKAPLRVFCSYAHEDEDSLDELRSHLAPLRQTGLIENWYDRDIPPGGDWDAEISANLEAADLILLLISADFVDSTYCMQVETRRALERHHAGEATVIPVFLRECIINELPFAELQGTPKDMRWINQQTFRDSGWTEVAEAVRDAASLGLKSVAGADHSLAEASEDEVKTQYSSFDGAAAHSANAQTGYAYVATADADGETVGVLRRGLLYLLIMIMCLAAGWLGWQWWFVKDANAQAAETFLAQGEYQQAREHCLAASSSRFRDYCLTFTGMALNNNVSSREVFLREAQTDKSEYAQVLLGDFRVADFDGENNPEVLAAAEKHYAEALKMNTNLPAVYFGQGLIRHLQGKPTEAVALYQQAYNMAPENGRFALNLATAKADAGDYADSEQLLRKALAISGEVIMGQAELIEVLAVQGKTPEAQQEARGLQAQLIQRGDKLICQPVNRGEWFVLQSDGPAFLPSWVDEGAASWAQKMVYLNDYVFKLAGVPPLDLSEPKCQI